jgi:hypothetical protein
MLQMSDLFSLRIFDKLIMTLLTYQVMGASARGQEVD